jgi:hypothetical protein
MLFCFRAKELAGTGWDRYHPALYLRAEEAEELLANILLGSKYSEQSSLPCLCLNQISR